MFDASFNLKDLTPKHIIGNDNPIRGIALAVLATFLFACLNVMTKHISQIYPVMMILWFRYLFFGAYGLAIGIREIRSEHLARSFPYFKSPEHYYYWPKLEYISLLLGISRWPKYLPYLVQDHSSLWLCLP